jgi:hypothetical protein
MVDSFLLEAEPAFKSCRNIAGIRVIAMDEGRLCPVERFEMRLQKVWVP